ncbi:glycosyltransferase family 2 protein [Sulfitobacter aestuarii]|uniref:Glycosyltransferase family 2 protein n=1 Tax=Sulfitobacter aestuarii TaxID=2161676 RepID=A0ABW5U4M4_9RHOB
MTKVSVIIAAWNADRSLERSVMSCLAQRDIPVEVLIVDDASTDGTAALARDLAGRHPQVRSIALARNSGPAAARNAGFDAARGDWLAVLDADDAMAPDRLARLVAYAEETRADAVYDNLAISDAADPDATIRPYLLGPGFDRSACWDLRFFLSNNLARPGKPSLGYLKPLFRRSFVSEHDLRYDPALRNGEDFHLMLDALNAGARLCYLPDAGYIYTTGAGSISNRLNLDHAQHLIAAADRFIARNNGKLPGTELALMRKRRRRLADLASAEAAMRALRDRRSGSALSALLSRPGAVPRFGRQLLHAFSKRLSSR